jgi:hypothetical protein
MTVGRRALVFAARSLRPHAQVAVCFSADTVHQVLVSYASKSDMLVQRFRLNG